APGDMYFALERCGSDGHSEIELAMERGAAAVVSQRKRAMRQRATVIEVADTRAALADVSARFYENPAENLRVIGVSGHISAWKTAFFLTSILRRNGVKTGLISTLRHEIGDRRLPSGLQPETLDLQRLFSEMVHAGCDSCVLQLAEISLPA